MTPTRQGWAGHQRTEDLPVIRKPDLENHNKDGGLWVVLNGKVYDVKEGIYILAFTPPPSREIRIEKKQEGKYQTDLHYHSSRFFLTFLPHITPASFSKIEKQVRIR